MTYWLEFPQKSSEETADMTLCLISSDGREEAAQSRVGLLQNIKDTRGNTVEKEKGLILQRSGGCNNLCAKQAFSFDTFYQKGHTYTQVEVQCIDCVQFSDAEFSNWKSCFLL